MHGSFRILLLLVIALVVAACGESSHDEYQDELTAVGNEVERALDEIPRDGSQLTGSSLVDLAAALEQAADELDDTNPPGEVERAHEQMITGFRDAAEVFERLGERLDAAGTESEQADLYVTFATDEKASAAFRRIDEAQDSFAHHGYRVFDAQLPEPETQGSASSTTPQRPSADAVGSAPDEE